MTYKGYLVEEINGLFVGNIKDIDIPKISDGNVLIKVKYSSLNYKDALASSGAKELVWLNLVVLGKLFIFRIIG